MKFTPELNKYFEHSGSDDQVDYYDLIGGHSCTCNGDLDVAVISVSRKNGNVTHVHDIERGELKLSPGAKLEVYKLTSVATFR
jgi:hypothetical protein